MHLRCCAFRLGRNDYPIAFSSSALQLRAICGKTNRFSAASVSNSLVHPFSGQSTWPQIAIFRFNREREVVPTTRESRAFSTVAIIYTAGYKRRLYARYCTVSKSPPFKPMLQVSKKNRDLEIFRNDKRKGEFTRFSRLVEAGRKRARQKGERRCKRIRNTRGWRIFFPMQTRECTFFFFPEIVATVSFS